MSVQYYAAATLDGYIAELDDTIDWLTGYEGLPPEPGVSTVEGGYEDFIANVGALVMGAVTYEYLLGVVERGGDWPYPGKPSWVLTSRELPVPDGEGVDVLFRNSRVPKLFDEMVSSTGERNLWVVGGGNVASQFADEGLLDEVIVTVVPVVIGEGKPLFDRRLAGGTMRLAGVLPRSNGMVELRYEVRG